MNQNSDIFGSCKCNLRFHQFYRKLTVKTPKTRTAQKKVTSTCHSKQKQGHKSKRFTFSLSPQKRHKSHRCPHEATPVTVTPEPVSPLAAPVIFFDTNVPGLHYRSPTPNPTNLELAQVQHYFNFDPREFQLIVELVNDTATFSRES